MGDWPGIFRGWKQNAKRPADVDSAGGSLTLGGFAVRLQADQLAAILQRLSLSQSSNMLELQDESGNPLASWDAQGGITFTPAFGAYGAEGVLRVVADGGYEYFKLDGLGNFILAAGPGTSPDGVGLGLLRFARDQGGEGGQYFRFGVQEYTAQSIYSLFGIKWTANTFKQGSPGGAYVQPTVPDGYVYALSGGDGITGAVEPAWAGSVVDGTVTWVRAGTYQSVLDNWGNTLSFNAGPSDPEALGVAPDMIAYWPQGGAYLGLAIGFWGELRRGTPTQAPADASVANSQRAEYVSDTVGNPRLLVIQRDSAGTVYHKIVADLGSDGSLDMAGAPVKNSLLSWPLAPTTNQTIPAGHGAIVDHAYKIAGGITTIGAGGKLRIL